MFSNVFFMPECSFSTFGAMVVQGGRKSFFLSMHEYGHLDLVSVDTIFWFYLHIPAT